jgi:hypothetical protein
MTDVPTDLREPENEDKPLSAFVPGEHITGINGTDSVWRVVKPGVLKRVVDGGA